MSILTPETEDESVRAADTDTTVCPDLVPAAVYGHTRSHVLAGRRHWVFESTAFRDRFLLAVSLGDFRRKIV